MEWNILRFLSSFVLKETENTSIIIIIIIIHVLCVFIDFYW